MVMTVAHHYLEVASVMTMSTIVSSATNGSIASATIVLSFLLVGTGFQKFY